MVEIIVGSVIGAAAGVACVILMRWKIGAVLRGKGMAGAAIIGLTPMFHFAVLLIAALFGRNALFSAAAGDVIASLSLGIFFFITGRK